jgi:hypothetical protein
MARNLPIGAMIVASIFKRSCDRKRPGAPWYYSYFDENGRRRTAKGCPDRVATPRIAAKQETEADLRRRGVYDPKAGGFAAHERKP